MEAATETARPKRKSRSDRYKDTIHWLRKDVEALETLTADMMTLLEHATKPGLTEPERLRLHHKVMSLKANLADDEQGSGKLDF